MWRSTQPWDIHLRSKRLLKRCTVLPKGAGKRFTDPRDRRGSEYVNRMPPGATTFKSALAEARMASARQAGILLVRASRGERSAMRSPAPDAGKPTVRASSSDPLGIGMQVDAVLPLCLSFWSVCSSISDLLGI